MFYETTFYFDILCFVQLISSCVSLGTLFLTIHCTHLESTRHTCKTILTNKELSKQQAQPRSQPIQLSNPSNQKADNNDVKFISKPYIIVFQAVGEFWCLMMFLTNPYILTPLIGVSSCVDDILSIDKKNDVDSKYYAIRSLFR